MLTLLQNKKINFLISLFAVSAVLFSAVPFSVATAATTKSELIKSITQDLSTQASENNLSGAGDVLGQQTTVPFFPRGFVYPIPELGNCNSKAACFQFCEQRENLEFCSMVSYRNGLMSASQLKKTLTFANYLQVGYFANCNDLGSCEELCSHKDVRSECDTLAINLDQGSRVLGVTDTKSESNKFSLLDYCKNNSGCYDQTPGGNNILTTLNNLIKSGDAPSACKDAEQCQDYCSMVQSTACNDLFTKLSYLSGTLAITEPYGKVLDASTDITQDVTSGQSGFGSGQSVGVVEPTQTAYQPQGALSCIIERQSVPAPLVLSDAEQADNFIESTQRCDKKYAATQNQAANYASSGKSKTLSGINSIYNCVMSLTSSADIQQCLNY
jgi:hypothetical protein